MRYEELTLPPGWTKTMHGYQRVDGAEVHSALRAKVAGWYVIVPGDTNFLRDERNDLRRWRNPEGAMRFLQQRYPLPLTESKWWDTEPNIILYHGTSDIWLEGVAKHGLCPIPDLKAASRDILRHYVPEEQWTPELLEIIDRRCVRDQGGGRSGDYGPVLFFTNEFAKAAGYAKANYQHGGEMANDVYVTARLHLADDPDISWKEFMADAAKVAPRYPEASPIVLEVNIPKSWVLYPKNEVEAVKANMKKAWEAKRPFAARFPSLEELLDDVWDGKEFRVRRCIPTEMIKVHRL